MPAKRLDRRFLALCGVFLLLGGCPAENEPAPTGATKRMTVHYQSDETVNTVNGATTGGLSTALSPLLPVAHVVVDGKRIGLLWPDKDSVFEIPANARTVQLKTDEANDTFERWIREQTGQTSDLSQVVSIAEYHSGESFRFDCRLDFGETLRNIVKNKWIVICSTRKD